VVAATIVSNAASASSLNAQDVNAAQLSAQSGKGRASAGSAATIRFRTLKREHRLGAMD
jgi:hypothetical protein